MKPQPRAAKLGQGVVRKNRQKGKRKQENLSAAQ